MHPEPYAPEQCEHNAFEGADDSSKWISIKMIKYKKYTKLCETARSSHGILDNFFALFNLSNTIEEKNYEFFQACLVHNTYYTFI